MYGKIVQREATKNNGVALSLTHLAIVVSIMYKIYFTGSKSDPRVRTWNLHHNRKTAQRVNHFAVDEFRILMDKPVIIKIMINDIKSRKVYAS